MKRWPWLCRLFGHWWVAVAELSLHGDVVVPRYKQCERCGTREALR